MSYWDTSALLKLYVTEEDSPAFLALAAGVQRVMTGFIGKYEARAVFRRREADQVLAAGAADLCYQKLVEHAASGRVEIVPESGLLEHEYGVILKRCLSQTPPVFIRTNDALHLAAAKVAGEVEFVSADIRQRVAAAFLGFTVLPAVFPVAADPPLKR